MEKRFKQRTKILDIAISFISVVLSVGSLVYGAFYYDLDDLSILIELSLNVLYILCLVLIGLYFYKIHITTHQFYYWCSICIGIAIFLRDILFPVEMDYSFHLVRITLATLMLLMLTYFYSRKEWRTYTKRNLWFILLVDVLIAAVYQTEVILYPSSELTDFYVTEIWIRPTITYCLVACYMSEPEDE
ncbi:MAG: hypothetical protein K5856_05025 [Bacteroidaceae bacterium]|nr:hypothetical protein [Bacteroidaceae bacterium]